MDLSEAEPLRSDGNVLAMPSRRIVEDVRFDRRELSEILRVYGMQVAAGEWRDYAITFGREKAVFAILRRTGETPLFRVEKDPSRAAKQGAYSVIAQGGLVLKRGADLGRVLHVLIKPPKLVG